MKYFVFVLAFIVVTLSYSQETGMVSGKILDAEMYNEPLLMASVSIEDTDFSAQTNFNGNFEIYNVLPGKYTLTVAFAGYDELSLPIEIKSNERLEILEELHAKKLPVFASSAQTTIIVSSL